MADLGDDAALPKVTQEQPDTAEVEVAPEDGADPLALPPRPTSFLSRLSSQEVHAADPQPPPLGGADLIADPLTGDPRARTGQTTAAR